MNKSKTASLEAKLKNSKDLVIAIRDLTLYDPTSDQIKINNYSAFVDEADSVVTSYKSAAAEELSARTETITAFEKLLKVCNNIRSEIYEITGENSVEAAKTESIVKLITGQNVSDNLRTRRKELAGLKEGEQPKKHNSVSATDRKSRVGNFRTLLGMLRTYGFYAPTDSTITIAALEALEQELSRSLENIAEKETAFATERSRIIQYFTGLKDRSQRAKRHVKRKYGAGSPEYRLLTKKNY